MTKRRRQVACTTVFLALSTATSFAYGQPVSDADRATARKLYFDGVELQNSQRYADALDRFERAERVVNAPTNLLHIAECNAAMNRLVEAAEKYRELARFPLAADASPAFKQAQEQGKSELAQMEPRIPELKVDVQPPNVPTLSVTVDDQPVNAALVGVSRPINPGVHRVAASAPGFTKAEQTIEVKEKAKQSVVLNLQSTGGVIYGPAGAGTGSAGSANAIAPASGGAPGNTPPAPPGADKPPAPYDKPAKEDARSRMSIFLGLRVGFTGVGGKYASAATNVTGPGGTATVNTTGDFSDTASGGGAIGFEGAFRFARMGYLGVVAEYESFGSKMDTTTNRTARTSAGLVAAKLGLISNPDGVAFMGDLGVGYRFFNISVDDSTGSQLASATPHGVEGQLGVGMHFKAGRFMRIAPMFELAVGSSKPDNSGTTTSGSGAFSSATTVDSATYAVFSLYVGGYFDIDLDKHDKSLQKAGLGHPRADNGMQGITSW